MDSIANQNIAGTNNRVAFRISGCEDRVELIDEINGNYVILHKPNLYSQIDCVYNYIIRNPNKIISSAEIERQLDGKVLSMSFTSIVSELGFTGKLRQLFFRASKNHIQFYNPITFDRLELMRIGMDDILPYFEQEEAPQMDIKNR
jgi:hypothetical protein